MARLLAFACLLLATITSATEFSRSGDDVFVSDQLEGRELGTKNQVGIDNDDV